MNRHTTTVAPWCMRALIALALLGLLLSAHVASAQDRLVLHQASYHFDRSQDFREFNPGLGWQRQTEHGFWQIGAYRNSVSRNSVYAALGTEPLQLGPVRLGGFAGVSTGYRYRVATDLVTTKQCIRNDPKPPECQTVTAGVQRKDYRPGLSPIAGLSAHLDLGAARLHLVATPTVRHRGVTHNHGALALLVSLPIQ